MARLKTTRPEDMNLYLPLALTRFLWIAIAVLVTPKLSAEAFPQQTENAAVQLLQEELAKRDAIIVDLLNRVRDLEADRFGTGSGPDTGEDPVPAEGPQSVAETALVPSEETGSGGDFEIDITAAERALERSLVQDGVRLLSPGQIEFTPRLAFSRLESDFPTTLMSGNENFIGEVRRTLDVYDTRADLRMGLPFNSQLELSLPSRVVKNELATAVDGTVQSVTERSGSGFGDVQIGLASVLAAEASWRPNVVGRIVWLTGSGPTMKNGVALGGGDSGLSTRWSAYWRRDPIVFLTNGGYTHYFEDGNLQAGDDVDLSLGAALAVSPETALIFSLDQTLVGAFNGNGGEFPETNRLSSILNISTSTILGRGLFLRLNAGVGLTKDSPGYQFGISLPFRFRLR